jgi:hypothetical protein
VVWLGSFDTGDDGGETKRWWGLKVEASFFFWWCLYS